MLDHEVVEDIEIYLLNEGLDDQQIDDFFASHDLQELDEDEAWEVVEAHIFRDTDISLYSE